MTDPKYRSIPLSGKRGEGKYALVSPEDYDRLSQFSWCVMDTGYIVRSEPGTNVNIRMHHDVIGFPPEGFEVDHKNGNTFDNRRKNLRFVTREQQMMNRRAWGQVEYKGVWMDRGNFAGQMKIAGQQVRLGAFPSAEAAALAYDAFAAHFYGEYARLNFPGIGPMHPEMAMRLRTKRSQERSPDMFERIITKVRNNTEYNGEDRSARKRYMQVNSGTGEPRSTVIGC